VSSGFTNQRGTCEQWIKEGKNAMKWTRLSCSSFAANAVRLQLHALAYNLANFMRTLALPETVNQWSLTSLREKLVKIGAKIVTHARYVTFQMAEVFAPRQLTATQTACLVSGNIKNTLLSTRSRAHPGNVGVKAFG
jgi:hypothetical protein